MVEYKYFDFPFAAANFWKELFNDFFFVVNVIFYVVAAPSTVIQYVQKSNFGFEFIVIFKFFKKNF